MATFSYTKPTVGASTDTWGGTLNTNWDNVAAVLGTVDSTDIQKLEAITATAAELNVLDGVTATTAELNLLDGKTAEDFFPSGGIIMWSGSVASVPSGWYLCDGNNGTPDLRNRFVVGAGSTYAVGATGGSADAIVVAHDHTYSGSTSAASLVGQFTASKPPAANGIVSIVSTNGGGAADGSQATATTYQIDASHSHTFSGTTASSGSSGTNANLPPYYALAYIMKA